MTGRQLGPLAGRRAAVVNWRDRGHSLSGGSERYAWEFALALRDAGAEVEFVTARDRHQSAGESVDGIEIRRAGGVFTFYAHAAAYYLRHRVAGWTGRSRLDVVVDPECGIPTFSPLFVSRRTAVVLVVHHVHQEQFRTYFPAALAAVGRFLERRVMPLVYREAATVAVSESTLNEMRRQLGWRRPASVLANGSVEPQWDCDADAKDPGRIVVLGRLVPHKRVDLVLAAVQRLAAEGPDQLDVRLDVIGRGPEDERLQQRVAELGLADRVTIHGFLPEAEKSALLNAASVHVCASDIEGWGQVVIEAAAHGVPTVARDVPGLRDSINDGHTGWLVPDHPGDPEAVVAELTDRLRRSLTELAGADERRRMVKECLSWASRYSWARMHRESVEQVLLQLARRNPINSRRLGGTDTHGSNT